MKAVFMTVALILMACFVYGKEDFSDVIVENVDEQDFQVNELFHSGIMNQVVDMDAEPKLTVQELKDLVCSDVQDATIEEFSTRESRSLQRRYCASFCLDFYDWCRRLCIRLAAEEGSLLHTLPCGAACTMHLASCCFT